MDNSIGAQPARRVLPGWSMGIRPIVPEDHDVIVEFLQHHWGGPEIVSLGRVHDAASLPGYIAPSPAGDLNGLITLHVDEQGCEIVTMNSVFQGRGIGTNLVSCAEIYARDHGSMRVWLVTTNDNVDAMAFYMRRGFRMTRVHRDSIEGARKLKPSIPHTGLYGIPILDQVEFEMVLPFP